MGDGSGVATVGFFRYSIQHVASAPPPAEPPHFLRYRESPPVAPACRGRVSLDPFESRRIAPPSMSNIPLRRLLLELRLEPFDRRRMARQTHLRIHNEAESPSPPDPARCPGRWHPGVVQSNRGTRAATASTETLMRIQVRGFSGIRIVTPPWGESV